MQLNLLFRSDKKLKSQFRNFKDHIIKKEKLF